jgi:hypothetical protein
MLKFLSLPIPLPMKPENGGAGKAVFADDNRTPNESP